MKQINNFNQLIEYFKQPEVEFCHIRKICSEGLKVYFIEDYKKDEAIEKLIDYWNKWKHTNERPLFID
jgi:hypothetical protein